MISGPSIGEGLAITSISGHCLVNSSIVVTLLLTRTLIMMVVTAAIRRILNSSRASIVDRFVVCIHCVIRFISVEIELLGDTVAAGS